jgi:acyl carrier protein phosphodiesterase
MNFLAHLYLSGEEEELIIGNFIADHVKGKQIASYSEGIVKGILLHRQIDSYTDQHATVLESKMRLRERYRHYAPVIVDIFYDHFLAVHWHKYSPLGLGKYSENVHATISKYEAILPEKSHLFFQYMLRHDILEAYGKVSGIQRVLAGMARRTPFISGMENATEELVTHYALFEQEFTDFFPQLQAFVSEHLTAFSTPNTASPAHLLPH